MLARTLFLAMLGLTAGLIFWVGLATFTTIPGRMAGGPAMMMPAPMAGGPAMMMPAPAAPVAQQPAAAPAVAALETLPLKVVATDLTFDLKEIKATAGQRVDLTLENRGLIEHDLTIDALQAKVLARPGQSVKGSFVAQKGGTYEFYCSIPGHKEAGMVGKLLVAESSDGRAGSTDRREPAQSPANPGSAALTTALPQKTGQLPPAPADLKPLPQPQVVAPLPQREPTLVKYEIETREVTARMDDGVAYTYWTFGGTVPGPMLRVRQGDTVELTLKNAPGGRMSHSIDLHAVTGPGGGARVTQIGPGESATFSFKALNPGVYVYHCATPLVPQHIANGMYGLIVVEPPGGWPPADREFYVMQGDFYLGGARAEPGMHEFSMNEMLDEKPDYVLFNGSVGSLSEANALKARVGETVRIFFGVGGPNLTSSFHVIGEIFDRVMPEGSAERLTNIQTTLVPAGGATVAEFKVDYPGTYILVDHSLGRLAKGAAGFLQVEGAPDETIFRPIKEGGGAAAGH